MKFWKEFIRLLEEGFNSIRNYLSQICKAIDDSKGTPIYTANDNPIKTIKNVPIKILDTNEVRNNLVIQNIGMDQCFIKLGDEATFDDFHVILAPDTYDKVGNGGSIELKGWHGSVYAICKGETMLSVLEY